MHKTTLTYETPVEVSHRFKPGDKIRGTYPRSSDTIEHTIRAIEVRRRSATDEIVGVYRYETGGYDYVDDIDERFKLAPKFSVGDVVTWGAKCVDYEIIEVGDDAYRMVEVGVHGGTRAAKPGFPVGFSFTYIDRTGELVERDDPTVVYTITVKQYGDAFTIARWIRDGLGDRLAAERPPQRRFSATIKTERTDGSALPFDLSVEVPS